MARSETIRPLLGSGKKATLVAALTGLAAASLPAPSAAELYGLVVGVDDYADTFNDLEGAVNDAELIAAALGEAGAREVLLLRDAAASKAAIESGWNRLVEQAAPGDTIVFSYAGHGSQEAERPGREAEADGLNENFLLGGYEESGPGTLERIVDDEINMWLTAAEDKGVEVVFVADSCHSGTMFRSAGSTTVRYRTGRFTDPDLTSDLLAMPPPAAALIEETDFKHVTFIAATQDGMLTPELIIDGKTHGALSWAFAKAVRGAADSNGDGQLSQQELLSYLVPTVQAVAENQQIPAILPLRPDTRPILPSAARKIDAPAGAAAEVALIPEPDPESGPGPHIDPDSIRLFVVGPPVNLPDVAGVVTVPFEIEADLIWNPGTGSVDHRIGGRVAERTGLAEIGAVLSKWSALAFLKARMSDNPVALSIPSGNQTYRRGEIVEFAVDGIRKPHLTLFNLPPNGRVELFIPANAAEASADWRDRRFSERFQVTQPPFGAEHMVAILTDEPALALHAALASMPTAATAAGLAAALRTLLEGTEFQAGVAAIYTTGGTP